MVKVFYSTDECDFTADEWRRFAETLDKEKALQLKKIIDEYLRVKILKESERRLNNDVYNYIYSTYKILAYVDVCSSQQSFANLNVRELTSDEKTILKEFPSLKFVNLFSTDKKMLIALKDRLRKVNSRISDLFRAKECERLLGWVRPQDQNGCKRTRDSIGQHAQK